MKTTDAKAALEATPPAPIASMLSNLLAVIHRDGGHYEAEHGTDKACADAEAIVVRLLASTTAPKVTEDRTWGEIPNTRTDDAHPINVLAGILLCAESWVPEARIIGNVRAGDIARAIRAFEPSDLQSLTAAQDQTAPKVTEFGPVPTYECEFNLGQPVKLAHPYAGEDPDRLFYVTGIDWEYRPVVTHGWNITIATAEDIKRGYGATDGFEHSDLTAAQEAGNP